MDRRQLPTRARVRGRRGSVLLLMPAAVLVVVVLGAIAVDRTIVFEAQRDLVATAQAAANDGASAVDVDRLRADGSVVADPALIEARVRATEATAPPGSSLDWTLDGNVLRVRGRRQVRLLFTTAIPGASTVVVVTATASAELRRR